MAVADSCDADGAAIAAFDALLLGESFSTPTVNVNDPAFAVPSETANPLYTLPVEPTLTDLTTTVVGGAGAFDVIMSSIKNHLKDEFQQGRITGREYADTYIAGSNAALSAAVQFLLGKNQAHWQGVLAQLQARRAEVEAIIARVELAKVKFEMAVAESQAKLIKTEYAAKKMELAIHDANYCVLLQQKKNLDLDASLKTYQLNNTLPEQKKLLMEQTEVQRAQTLDTRSNAATVTGLIGKQKALYNQQIESYKRDAEIKVGKLFTDPWITQMTLDEGLGVPNAVGGTNINNVISAIRTANGL